MNIIVTGAAGFLGSNLINRLLEEKHTVFGIDDFSSGCERNLLQADEYESFRLKRADVTDLDIDKCFPDEVDVVVHLAARKIPRYGGALDTLKVNYLGTETVLDFARKRGCKCVLASTSDVYGMNPELPFSEESSNSVIGSSKSPRWAYAVSKLFDEHMALAYMDEYGFPITMLRFFGSYGPNQTLSWLGGPPPVFIEKVFKDEPIPIHGDGQQTRSFTYVDDTVNGIFNSIFRDEANGEIINIGSVEEVTILELAQRVKKASGTAGELKVDFVPYESFTGKKYQDVMRRVPDTRLCKKLLGVEAQVSLDDGLARTIEWQKQVMDL